ncbi:MAG TPA: hypothetical protein VFE60_12925, partial [Roseiarcus sp.]|nr:hypothetical protein [Roseiarcus sp.]
MLDQIVAKFSDAHFLAMLFAAIGSAATVLTAAMPWLQPDTLSRRIKAVSSERERIRARERERLQASQNKGTLRVKPSGLVKQLVETLNLSSWLSTEKAKMQLAMAGYRGAGAEYAFLSFRLLAPIAFFLAAIIYQFLIIKWNQPAMVIAVAATYLGIKAPELFLRNKTTKRQKELERAFPNTLVTKLATALNPDGHVEVFAIGTDGAPNHIWQTSPGGPWSNWDRLGGSISITELATPLNPDRHIEVFAIGSDG